MRKPVSILLICLMLLTTFAHSGLALVYQGPYWESVGVTAKTINDGQSATAHSGTFDSSDNYVHILVELETAQGSLVKVLMNKDVSVSQYTGYETIIITESDYSSPGNYRVHFTLNDAAQTKYGWLDLTVAAVQQPACSDGLDNDGDTKIDYPSDPGCSSSQDNDEYNAPPTYQCSDGADNDNDGATDYPSDFSCSSSTDNDETYPKAQCQNNQDDDGDGLVDSNDPGCTSNQDNSEYNAPTNHAPVANFVFSPATPLAGQTVTFTSTSSDPDGDALTLSWDFNNDNIVDKTGVTATYVFNTAGNKPVKHTASDGQLSNSVTKNVPVGAPQCMDNADNDNDGLTDMNDPGCSSSTDNDESNGTSQCQDGLDNDGDGAIDDPADFSCSSPQDNDETNPKADCQDGLDNDTDGKIDFPADPGCSSNQDDDEYNAPPTYQCSDGVDNDGDGATDYPADFSCSSPQDNDETNPRAQCQDGLDNDFDGLTDLNDPGCSSNQDNSEGDGTSQCQDGLDNDSDGATDYPADFSCSSPQDNDETNPRSQCQDGIDNDNDDLVDFPADPGCSSRQDNVEFNLPVYQCNDGVDNDEDGLVDLADPGCSGPTDDSEFNLPVRQCNDGLDNDDDGLVDLADPGCSSPLDDSEFNIVIYQCMDGIDNDGDGLVDLADPGCSSGSDDDESNGTSQCQDGLDNDGDGATDYPADFSCSSPQDNDETNPRAQCQDGLDNDFDGLTDLNDPGCSSNQDNSEGDGTSQCQDDVDNDNDGLIDFPLDPGCSSPQDNSEFNVVLPQCMDGVDNDGDGYTDALDPGCTGAFDNDERTQCQDDVDNDNDGLTDFPADPGCTSVNDDSEAGGLAQCQDGLDNDHDGLIDMLDPGCSSPIDNDEGNGTSQCQDGVDNDDDGAIDYPLDIGCSSPQDNDESNSGLPACADGLDNDGDGLVDLADPGCSSPADTNEGDGTSQCQDGLDNDVDGLVDLLDPGCASRQDNDEIDGTLVITNLTCFPAVVENTEQSCSVKVVALGTNAPVGSANVELFFDNNDQYIKSCVTDSISGSCAVNYPVGAPGTYTVYATATKAGFIADQDENPKFTYQVVDKTLTIENLAVYNDPAFTVEDYDFFRGQMMYVKFNVVDDFTHLPYDDAVTSVTLVSPPGGRADMVEAQPNVNGVYYYRLQIPTTHEFLGDSQVFTFAFRFDDGTGDEKIIMVRIRNNPPVILPSVAGEFDSHVFSTPVSISLTPYETDVEDSGAGLQWSISGIDGDIFTATVDSNDVLSVTPLGKGTDTITLTLRDLDGDIDTFDVRINVWGTPHVPACADGVDNDADGLYDMADPGCSSPVDDDEFDAGHVYECSDGLDNDNDGLVDMSDPGCANAHDDDESGGDVQLPQCSDGLDNDGDGLIDLSDPDCVSINDDREGADPVHEPRKSYLSTEELLVPRIYVNGRNIDEGFALANDVATFSVAVENQLGHDADRVRVEVAIDELGVRATDFFDDIDDGETVTSELEMDIPCDEPGIYDVRIIVSNDEERRVKYRTLVVV